MGLAENKIKINDPDYPVSLVNINHAPKQLYWVGAHPSKWIDRPKVAIVGSRKISNYGQQVTHKLTFELAHAGVVIISGLALGVDAVAHKAALEAGGITVAVLPTPLNKIAPTTNYNLSQNMIKSGGTLITEYANGVLPQIGFFTARNRIVSGLADVLLITEAGLKSGTMNTARFALEQGRTVMVVPGNITSPGSEGCNNLIKSGATPVTCAEDVLFALGITPQTAKQQRIFRGTLHEQKILELITAGTTDQEELALLSKLDSATLGSTLTMLEISGHIRPLGGGNWTMS